MGGLGAKAAQRVCKFPLVLSMYGMVKQSSQHVHGKENTKNSACPDLPSRKASKKQDR